MRMVVSSSSAASHSSFSAAPIPAQDSDRGSPSKPRTIRFRLSSLCQNGQLQLARQLFDAIPHPTTVLWNTLIIGCICNDLPHEAISLYCRMRYTVKSDGPKCDAYTYSSVLKACTETRQLLIGKAVHCHVLRSDLHPSRIIWSSLLNMYSTCHWKSDSDLVERVFRVMRKRNVVSWNIMISWYAKMGRFMEAFRHMVMMMRTGVSPSVVSFVNVIPAVSGLRSIDIACALYGMLTKYGEDYSKNLYLVSSSIIMFAELGYPDYARKVFNNALEKNAHVWNAMIGGYVLNSYPNLALQLFSDVLETQCEGNIDEVTFVSALTAASDLRHFDVAQQVHAYLIKSSFISSVVILNALMSLYSKCNSIVDTQKVFSRMKRRDAVSWNTMICALVQNELEYEGLMLAYEMQKQGISVDDVTITALLSIASSLRNHKIGKQVHAYLIRHGFQFTGMESYLIYMYAKSGFVKVAEEIFKRTCRSNRDLATWNSMISGYTQNALFEEALHLFQQMLQENIFPNSITLASILPACSKLGWIELGKRLHCFSIRSLLDTNLYVSSALVDMYSKSGSINYAERVFTKATEKNSVTYTNMILGYGQHGLGDKALNLFHSMKETGIKPDAITFVAALSACSYAGLINEGLHLFQSMQAEHGITPSMEHYACVVDMLGRVGRLSEAYDIAGKVNREGDVLEIWGSLLSACKVHHNFELGKLVASKMLEIQVSERAIGYHVLLSNIHAEERNWEYVKSVRREMVDRGLTKEVGCSWIEVCGNVFSFVSRDGKHPRGAEIYEMLMNLSANLKDADYMPYLL